MACRLPSPSLEQFGSRICLALTGRKEYIRPVQAIVQALQNKKVENFRSRLPSGCSTNWMEASTESSSASAVAQKESALAYKLTRISLVPFLLFSVTIVWS